MRRRRVALAVALALGLAGAALAQLPATLSVDGVLVKGGGRHRVIVSVLDDVGTPCPGLENAFRVTVDGRPVEDLVAKPGREAQPGALVSLVVDAGRLSGESLAVVRGAVTVLARGLSPGDRLRVVAAGTKPRAREAPAGGAAKLAAGLGDLRDDGTPRLYDAIWDAVREAAHRPAGHGAVVVVVTRGVDAESAHGPLDLIALARGPERLTPILVAQLGDAGAAAESERLARLATHAAGAVVAVTSTAGLSPALDLLVRRGLDHWVLTFRDPGWKRDQPRHQLSLVVERDGVRRTLDAEYSTAEALAAPWWRSPGLGLGLLILLLAGLAALLASRRRQLGLLVHDQDADDGVWYEIFGYPVTLGAAQGNDIVIADGHVSRNHAVLERRGRTVELVDLNSENGTRVNDERVTRRVLADGDRVSLGPDVHLIYEARG